MKLIIYEGEKTEPKIFQNIKENLFNEDTLEIPIEAAYGGNIYSLYKECQSDPDLDLVAIIKESIRRKNNSKTITMFSKFLQLSVDDFSEIYLFFDCDIHHHPSKQNEQSYLKTNLFELEEMLTYFDEETEKGKLYISYPMIEALIEVPKDEDFLSRCKIVVEDFRSYKKQTCELYASATDFSRYTQTTWKKLCQHNIKKANFIISQNYVLPSYNVFTTKCRQLDIFKYQKILLLNENKVYIISAIPLFLVEYFGRSCWQENGLLS